MSRPKRGVHSEIAFAILWGRLFLKFLLYPKVDERIRRYTLFFGNRLELLRETFIDIDVLVKSRHSGGNRSPENF